MKDLYPELVKIINTMITECASPKDVASKIMTLYSVEVIDPLTRLLVNSNEKTTEKKASYEDYINENHFKG